MDVEFRELRENADSMRKTQVFRRSFFMSAMVLVPNGGKARAYLISDDNVDIQVTGMVGTITAPATILGQRAKGKGTIFPLNGNQPALGFAERGLIVRLFDGTDKEKQLSDPLNYMNAKNYFQPGYLPGAFEEPVKFPYFLRASSKLVFDFINTDTYVDVDESPIRLYHAINITLTCRKIEAEAK